MKEWISLVTDKLDKLDKLDQGVEPEELGMLEMLVDSAMFLEFLPESSFAAYHLARFEYLMGSLTEEPNIENNYT